ncbi:MAG TPA: hypothetical protein VE650_05765, partial [Acetobacteraceae bacterium]|nr:hypothetical protein [Acetobacteraceae bacterium]
SLLAERVPDESTTERALLEAAALRREHPDDVVALQRVDPDVATAIDRMLGEPAPKVASEKRRASRATSGRRNQRRTRAENAEGS